jgi:hypothetical protein
MSLANCGIGNQAAAFEVEPVEGETRQINGVSCAFAGGVYSGSRDGITVTAWRSPRGPWVVRVEVGTTVLVDDLDACAVAA